MIKQWLQRWLEIPSPADRDRRELAQLVAKAMVDILEGREPRELVICGGDVVHRVTSFSKIFEDTLRRAVAHANEEEIKEKIHTQVKPWIEGEKFLDDVVERLRKKQLPCTGAGT